MYNVYIHTYLQVAIHLTSLDRGRASVRGECRFAGAWEGGCQTVSRFPSVGGCGTLWAICHGQILALRGKFGVGDASGASDASDASGQQLRHWAEFGTPCSHGWSYMPSLLRGDIVTCT